MLEPEGDPARDSGDSGLEASTPRGRCGLNAATVRSESLFQI